MTQKDRDRLVALKKAKKGLITQREVSEEIGQSERHIHRLLKKLKGESDKAIVRALRGRQSNRKLDDKVKEQALEILSGDLYAAFGPTLAAEYLSKDHGIKAGREPVHRQGESVSNGAESGAGQQDRPRASRTRHRSKRPRASLSRHARKANGGFAAKVRTALFTVPKRACGSGGKHKKMPWTTGRIVGIAIRMGTGSASRPDAPAIGAESRIPRAGGAHRQTDIRFAAGCPWSCNRIQNPGERPHSR
jgi:hypothetical protein